MAKILILYASIGQGHKTASVALQEQFQQMGDHEVVVEDILDYALPVFKSIYSDSYLELMEKAPDFMALLYRLSDKANSEFSRELVALYSRLGVPHLRGFGESSQPDVIIITHHLGVHLMKPLIKTHKNMKVFSVITDYTTTSMETHKDIQGYFVANNVVKEILAGKGIDPDIVTVTGIPVKSEVSIPKNQQEIQKKLKVTKTPVLTICGSGIRDTKIVTLLQTLKQSFTGTVFVVTGRNITLQDKLEKAKGTENMDLRIFDHIDFMDDLIVASDLVITKAGGLMISETLARGKPILFFTDIRGQEEWNADYVCMEGAGLQIHTPELVPTAIKVLCTNESRKNYMSERAKALGRPEAAATIASTILEKIRE